MHNRGLVRRDVCCFLAERKHGCSHSMFRRIASWSSLILACSLRFTVLVITFLLKTTSQGKLVTWALPHSRHEAGSKVEGHPVCHFPGTVQHFLVFVGWNLVPGAHLDEVSLRDGSLFWEVIKKGRPDTQWRAFRLNHGTQSQQGAVAKNQQSDNQKVVENNHYLSCSLSRTHSKGIRMFSLQQSSHLLTDLTSYAPATLQNALQSGPCGLSLYFSP